MAKNTRILVSCIAIAALLSGCASTTPVDSLPADSSKVSEHTKISSQTSAPGLKKPIAPETLYDLLIAEMAGKVNRLEIALGNYMRQAHLTKDPKVVERYAKIASYMQAHQAAKDASELWLSIEPDNIDALHLMLITQISQSNADKQEFALRQLLAQTEQLNLLLIEQQLNSTSVTQRKIFSDVLFGVIQDPTAQFSKNEQLWYLKAKLSSLAGAHEQVVTEVKQLHKIDVDFLPSYVLLVDAYEKTNQLENAEAALKNLIRLDPENKKVRLYYARMLVRLQKFSQANAEFKTLLNLYPEDLDLHLTAGILSLQVDNLDQARFHFKTLLDAPYRTNDALFQLAALEDRAKNKEKAIELFLKVNPSPAFQEARLRAAQLLNETGQLDQAIATLTEAGEMQPKSQGLYTLAIVELYAENQQYDAALEKINVALQNTENEASLLYSRAILFTQMDRYAEAETDLREVLRIAPDNVAALNALGYTFADQNIRLDEAEVLLKKAIELSPNDPPILDSLGWLAFRQGNLRQAREYLEAAYKLLQDHEIAAHLGEVLWLSGEEKQAQKIWREALEQNPKSDVLKSTMERFKQ